MASLLNKPYNTNGIPNPRTKLKVKEPATPKYCPKKIEERFIGCGNSSSVNSLELQQYITPKMVPIKGTKTIIIFIKVITALDTSLFKNSSTKPSNK